MYLTRGFSDSPMNEDEIADDQQHARYPPPKGRDQPVARYRRVINGQRILRVAGRENVGEDANRCGGQSGKHRTARREVGIVRSGVLPQNKSSREPSEGQSRKEQSPGPVA